MKTVRLAIAGVGNCASSLIQGLEYYRHQKSAETAGLMHADIGGFLGLGQTRVKLAPAQFKLQGDRVVLDLTAAQANDLPKVQK